MRLLLMMLCAEYSYLYEAEDERTLSDGGLAFDMLVCYPVTDRYAISTHPAARA
jgi:hypothetical protein